MLGPCHPLRLGRGDHGDSSQDGTPSRRRLPRTGEVNWVFLDVAGVQAVQADLIETYGGSHGIRDAGLL